MTYTLSPLDYYFFRPNLYTIQFVFEYKGRLNSGKFQEVLKEASNIYKPIKCKLRSVSDFTLQLEEDDAPIPLTITELNSFPSELDALIDSVTNIPGSPLLKFKISYFQSKTYLGISFSHMLGDGSSFMDFLISLSKVFNDLPVKARPCSDRTLLYQGYPRETSLGSKERLFKNTGYSASQPHRDLPCEIEKIIFTFEELEDLKKGRRISSNALMMASLLKRYHLRIPLAEDGKLIVRCPVDYRNIYSKVPLNYFGNAVRDAVSSFDPATFANLELVEIAEQIQQNIKDVNEESIYKSLQTLDDLRQEHSTSVFNELSCPGLLISNVSKLPFHEVNFGLGGPVAIHHASPIPQLAVILAHPTGFEASIRVAISKHYSRKSLRSYLF